MFKKLKKAKKIGVLTSGGDCPGLNMAVKVISQYAMQKHGWEVIGIKNAINGILSDIKILEDSPTIINFTPTFPFNSFVRQGGTFLGSYRRIKTKLYKDVQTDEELVKVMLPRFKKQIKKLGIDGLIATGGDGSMYMLNFLCGEAKIPFVGIPKTIDNDNPGTDISIGFSTAVDTCIDALDKIFWTAKGHRRAMVTEVMGRSAGHLAMHSGVGACADVILVPEIPYKLSNVIKKIRQVISVEEKDYFLIVVAEGCGLENGKPLPKGADYTAADYVAKALDDAGIEARSNSLGYLQRGGIPNGYDRMLAAEMSVMAVDLMAEGSGAVMIGMKNGKPTPITLEDVAKKQTRVLDLKSPIVSTAQKMGIYVGELKDGKIKLPVDKKTKLKAKKKLF